MKTIIKNKNKETGQALMEVIICLILMFTLFSLGLFVSIVGTESIVTLKTARGKLAEGSLDTVAPNSITEWNIGGDELLFTFDDNLSINSENDEAFEEALITYDDQGVPKYIKNIPNQYTELNFANTLPNDTPFPENGLFIEAAQLTGSKGNPSSVLESGLVLDIVNALETFSGLKIDLSIEEHEASKVYMPEDE